MRPDEAARTGRAPEGVAEGAALPVAPAVVGPDGGAGRPRWGYLLLAYLCLALGLLGIALPVLPTTPFVLAAAWAASRGSPRLHRWLHGHRRFGPALADWETHGAVPRRAKWLAIVMMGISAALMWAMIPLAWVAALVNACLLAVAAWLWRRPEPPSASTPGTSPADGLSERP